MNDERIREALLGADGPRSPRPEFERALLQQLTGDARRASHALDSSEVEVDAADMPEIADLDDDRAPARRRTSVVVGAIAAVLALIAGLAVVVAARDGDVAVTNKVSVPPAEAACQQFSDARFGGVSGSDLLGIRNDRFLADESLAASSVAAFEQAVRQLQSDLQGAGAESARLDGTFGEILRNVDEAKRFIADGELSRAPARLQDIEGVMIELERELTRIGVVNCVTWLA